MKKILKSLAVMLFIMSINILSVSASENVVPIKTSEFFG